MKIERDIELNDLRYDKKYVKYIVMKVFFKTKKKKR
jgi:hypothetical protein